MPSIRSVWFRLHWALGLTAGLVLAQMGLTGALMSYEEAITTFANRDRLAVTAGDRRPLPPSTLAERVETGPSGHKVGALTLSSVPVASVRVRFARDPGTGMQPTSVYVDPYDGTVVGPVRLEGAFATVRGLHRWLLLPGGPRGWGRTITGACTLGLLVFLATGLYLRWPRVHRWGIWLRPSLSRPGRARWWSLHAVAGTWLTPVYLVVAFTGLTWSYPSFKDGATWLLGGGRAGGAKPRHAVGRESPPTVPAIDRAWAAFRDGAGRQAGVAVLTLPGPGAAAIQIRWSPEAEDASTGRNEATYDAVSGMQLAAERAADTPLGRRLLDNVLEVHRGRFFGGSFALLFCLAALAVPGFAGTGLTLYFLRRRSSRRRGSTTPGPTPAPHHPPSP